MTTKIGNTLAAALVAAIAATSVAQAATTIDTRGFSLQYLGDEMQHPFDMRLLSDFGDTVRIGMDVGMQRYLADALNGPASAGDGAEHLFAGFVRQGYRITSLALSGLVRGDLTVEPAGQCGGCEIVAQGTAGNRAIVGLSVGGPATPLVFDEAFNIDGATPLQASVAGPLDGTFALNTRLWQNATASPTHEIFPGPDHTTDNWYNALATVGFAEVVLTVQVAAVPEPSTYAMLLAGLGVAGWAARRRRPV